MAELRHINVGCQTYDIAPTNPLQTLIEGLYEMGISMEEFRDSIKAFSHTMANLNWCQNEITAIKDAMDDLRYVTESNRILTNEYLARHDYLINNLRPALAADTENPNQKDDLEISSQIVPSLDFLKLEDNMFIN